MKRFLFILLFSFLIAGSQAQDSTRYFRVSLSLLDNATVLPYQGFSAIFKGPVHPGITVGTEFNLKKGRRTEWYQTVKLGYFYQHYVQHAVQLYSETGYRYTHKSGFGAFGQLGAGYIHSFADQQLFVFKDGRYEKKFPSGRANVMLSLSPGIHYDFSKKGKQQILVFFTYQAWLQLPYVKKYVTILPNVAFQVGAVVKLKRK